MMRIGDPQPRAVDTSLSKSRLAEPVVEAPVIMEEVETATALYDGPGVTYVFPTPVTVANGVDAARIALDSLEFDAEVFARAVPLSD